MCANKVTYVLKHHGCRSEEDLVGLGGVSIVNSIDFIVIHTNFLSFRLSGIGMQCLALCDFARFCCGNIPED
jgi:hypothetical protein